ncbi:50S ribosomal protein L25 [bacterium]|nr:50S ribosomal protein L25 [bacterium]NUN46449.1 50S ribosomal protein L25 [bacterium]HMV25406.1 50S ribosomal protein L25 [bacterium]HMW33401.1 50S ribosomal protein L25 [bacterium]HMW37023.1 50S ribosomal protein L25 [bacterium]
MQETTLTAERRPAGKHSAKHARKQGKVPGVFYGYGQENVSIQLDAMSLAKFLMTEHTLATITIDGKEHRVIVRDFDKDPVTGRLVHVDVMAVRMDRPIDVYVPIVFIGSPIGVRTKGGIFQHDMTEFHIKCLPNDIPAHLEVKIDDLDLNHAVHIRDLNYPNITILNPASESVCTVVIPKALESVLAEAQAAPTEPEVIAKGKEVAGEGEKAPEKK